MRLHSFFCTALLGILAMAWGLALSSPVRAQWGTGNPAPLPMPAETLPQDTDPAGRLNRLEQQLREINGRLEQMQFQNKTLQDQIKRMQADTEFRFQELEGKKGAKSLVPPQKRSEAPPPQAALAPPPKDLGQLIVDRAGAPVPPGAESQALPPVPGSADDMKDDAVVAAPSADPKDEYDLAYGYMLRGDYVMAETALKSFIATHPGDANMPNAHYWLGEAQYQRKNYKGAAESYLKVYNDYPNAAKAPESLMRLGTSLRALGQKDAACSTYAEVARKFPKASNAVKTRVQAEQRSAGC